MKFLRYAALGMVLAVAAGCGSAKPEGYRQSDIQIVSQEIKRHQITLTYRPPQESQYYSPGAQVVGNGKTTSVTLVRCRIKGKCPTNIPGETPSAGLVRVHIPYTGQPVVIAFSDSTVQIKP